MTKDDVMNRLRELGVKFDRNDKKGDLVKLLPEAERPDDQDDEEQERGFVFTGIDDLEEIMVRDVVFPVGVPVDLSDNPSLAQKVRVLPYFVER